MTERQKLLVIGAGQKADLITVRGLKRLSALDENDIVLYDRLIDESILEHTRARTVNVGKLPYCHSVRQDQINELIEHHLAENVTVCRLKGGDSVLFARLTEEVQAAVRMNVPVEVIPGVTTMSAAAARICAGLTSRDDASGLITLTGHKRSEALEEEYDWDAIARLKMTIVIYMTVKNLPSIAEKLTDHGMPPSTPVLIAEKVETDAERLIFSNLAELGQVVAGENISFPAIAVIGNVVATSPASAVRLTETDGVQ